MLSPLFEKVRFSDSNLTLSNKQILIVLYGGSNVHIMSPKWWRFVVPLAAPIWCFKTWWEPILGTREALGTWSEPHGKMMGTRGKKTKKKSLSLPLPPSHHPPQEKKKKVDYSWVHAESSHWLHEISLFFQNCSSPFFLPRLIPLLRKTQCT